jgi:DoxX-like protein
MLPPPPRHSGGEGGSAATVVVLSILLAVVLAPLGTFKLINHPKASETAQRLGISLTLSRTIGVLELSAAGALLIGLAWAPLGVAAAVGLTLLLLGATASHLRVHDPVQVASFPFLLALLSVATLILQLQTT